MHKHWRKEVRGVWFGSHRTLTDNQFWGNWESQRICLLGRFADRGQ